MHVERTFTVARPIGEVFSYLGDFTNTDEWDPGTVSTVRTSGEGGLGTTYRNTSQFLGRRVELTYETVTYVVPTRLQFRGRNGRTTATDSLTLRATADHETEIHYRADFEFSPLLRLLAPLVLRRKLPAIADETAEQLQASLTL